MKALLWNNPRVPYLVRLECRGLEEVKSTVQARYTTTYILVQDVCVEQTYDAILVSMSHDDVGDE